MDFDIHQLDHARRDSEENEKVVEAFQQALLERFLQSPEGQSRLKADPDIGFWTTQLMYYGDQYEGVTVPKMTVGDVHTVVTELFPRKISLQSPEQADDTIPELLAFWNYLKREFNLPQADAVLEFLRDVQPDFPGMMNDSSNFGMAKSVFSMGHAAGFDMTTQEGLDAFMLAFNTGQLARQSPPASMPMSYFPAAGRSGPSRIPSRSGPSMPKSALSVSSRRLDPAQRNAERKAEKKKRKRAEEAQKKNRKRGK